MNKLYLIIYTLIILSACNQQKSSTAQNVDTALQTTDTISSGKTLNDIRFKDWDRSDWLDKDILTVFLY